MLLIVELCSQLEGRIRELSTVEERLRDIEMRLEEERGQWLLERTELTSRLGNTSGQSSTAVNNATNIIHNFLCVMHWFWYDSAPHDFALTVSHKYR